MSFVSSLPGAMRKTCPRCTIDYIHSEHEVFTESYVVIEVEDDYDSGDSRRQVMQTGLTQYIREGLSAAINIANLVLVVLSISVKDTDVGSRLRSGQHERSGRHCE